MINICQLLCPERHCILGMAYDPEDYSPREIETKIVMGAIGMRIDPRCGICGSTQTHFEHGTTKFKTMEEAEPELIKAQAANLASRTAIDEMKRTARNN